MNWTKEEIENSKEIAKYFRKPLEMHDFVEMKETGYIEVIRYIGGKNNEIIELSGTGKRWFSFNDAIPLWTLTDCLEWLEGKGFLSIELWRQRRTQRWVCRWEDNNLRPNWVYSSTMTASAQLAVLEILQGGANDLEK